MLGLPAQTQPSIGSAPHKTSKGAGQDDRHPPSISHPARAGQTARCCRRSAPARRCTAARNHPAFPCPANRHAGQHQPACGRAFGQQALDVLGRDVASTHNRRSRRYGRRPCRLARPGGPDRIHVIGIAHVHLEARGLQMVDPDTATATAGGLVHDGHRQGRIDLGRAGLDRCHRSLAGDRCGGGFFGGTCRRWWPARCPAAGRGERTVH